MKSTNEHESELKGIRRVLWLVLASVLLLIALSTTSLGQGDSGKLIGTLAGYAALFIAGVTGLSMAIALARRPDKGLQEYDEKNR